MNEAVEIAHVDGIVSAASLMVAGADVRDALARARRLPDLRIGLHLSLVEDRPFLPCTQIPHLVDRDGRLRCDLVAFAWDIARSRQVREELYAEIDAQFAAFASTGLVLDHVNAHKHFHLHPLVGAMVLKAGARYGMAALRIPLEPAATIKSACGRAGSVFPAGVCARRLRRRAAKSGLFYADHVFGLRWSGAMGEKRLKALLGHLPAGTVEIYTHPATADLFAGCAPGYAYREELAALTDPQCADLVRRSGRELGGYLGEACAAGRVLEEA